MFNSLTNSTTSNKSYEEGVITEVVRQNHKWRVYFDATYWFAKSRQPVTLNPGDYVSIVGQENASTLLIEPI